MNALVIYFSMFGHTQEIAETIASTLGSARVVSLDAITVSDLEEADLVVMGSPTHRMNLPEAVRLALNALPRRILHGTPVAAFDTSYKISRWLTPFTAAKRLNHKLRQLGGKPVVPPETFYVMERKGPLYDGEIERAQAWADQLQHAANRRVIAQQKSLAG